MVPILINLFYLAVLALVIAAGVYLRRTRDQAAAEARETEDASGEGSPEDET